MAKGKDGHTMEWQLPNGDKLVARYDGEKLALSVVGKVGSGRGAVFRRRFTNKDLTGQSGGER